MAFQLHGRPLNCQLDIRKMPMSEFSKRAKAFHTKDNGVHNKVRPEKEALKFYMGNHALHALKMKYGLNRPMSPEDLALAEEHFKMANDVFMRLFYYTLVICVRETRHLNNAEKLNGLLKAEGIEEAYSLITKVPDDSSAAMQSIINQQHPELSIYALCKGMSIAFNKIAWQSGYGGKAWGTVADSLVNLVTGKHSPEMFCDVAFALAHNNGPIFNKGMFYASYGIELQMILDCQRGGQIPRLVKAGQFGLHLVDLDMNNYAKNLESLGEDFVGPVDWEKVQEAGPVGNYSNMFTSKQQKEAEAKKAAEALAKQKEQQELNKHVKGKVTYFQGKSAIVTTREGLKALDKLDQKKVM